jgi:hypothetical protein
MQRDVNEGTINVLRSIQANFMTIDQARQDREE